MSIDPGTGEEAFEAVQEGQLLSPTWGSQGGMHIWGSLQARWLHPRDVDFDLSVSTDEGYIARSWGRVELDRVSGERTELLGQPMFLELSYSLTPSLFSSDPNPIDDWDDRAALYTEAWDRVAAMDLVLRAEATDECGTTATAETTVRADTAGLDDQ